MYFTFLGQYFLTLFIFSFTKTMTTFLPSLTTNSDLSNQSQSALCSQDLAPQMQKTINTTKNLSKKNSLKMRCINTNSKKEDNNGILLINKREENLFSSIKCNNISSKIFANFRARIATQNLYSYLFFTLFTILFSLLYFIVRHICLKTLLFSSKNLLKISSKSFERSTFLFIFLFIGTFTTLTMSQSHSSFFMPQTVWSNGGGGSQLYSPGGSLINHHQWQQKSTREIMLSVVKNISEATPVGEILLNFRAEDKSSPTYNLT